MTKSEAEKQISEILKQVEASYGCYVNRVDITKHEVTSVNDDHKRYLKYVQISLVNEKWIG